MAQYDINSYNFKKANTFGDKKVGYFSLKNDGDSAVVRFAYSSINDISVETVHKLVVDGRWRSISCIKGAYDPIDNCPLCREGYDLKKRVFVKLIEYVPTQDGKISVEAKIWDRPAEGKNDFVKKLINMLNSCGGDLTNYLFTITRSGDSGSTDTTYDINPILNMAVYPESLYVKDFSAFEGFTPAHHSFMLKTKEELEQFIETGKFPARDNGNKQGTQQGNQQAVNPTPVQATPVSTPNVVINPTLGTDVANVVANPTPVTPVETAPVDNALNTPSDSTGTTTRPRRVYDF